MLSLNDIELTDAEILEVEEAILHVQKQDWFFLVEAVAEMPNSIGTRWQRAVQEDDGVQQAEAMNQAIIDYAKQTGLYGDCIMQAKEQKLEEHEERLNRRAVGE